MTEVSANREVPESEETQEKQGLKKIAEKGEGIHTGISL